MLEGIHELSFPDCLPWRGTIAQLATIVRTLRDPRESCIGASVTCHPANDQGANSHTR